MYILILLPAQVNPTVSVCPMKLITLLHVFTLLSVAVVGCNAVNGPGGGEEEYWKFVLPNTPMPKAVKDLLYATGWNNENAIAVEVGNPDLTVTAGKPVHHGPDVGVGTGGIGVHSTRRGKPISVGLHPGHNPFVYNYAPSEDQLQYDPNVALFFLENDLHKGTEMNLHFTKNHQKSTFLPRKIADSIPFSSNNLPQIYNRFSIRPKSMEAEVVKQTINECENRGIEGEEKYCATSLASMIDFITEKLGHKVRAISTEVDAKQGSSSLQKYKIQSAKKLAGDKSIVCHRQNYVYAVFYCHKTVSTRAYAVSMAGADGVKVKAVAVCHTDTGKWNPKHLAFRVLKVKPGSIPVCHFLPEDHLVWIPY